MKKELKALITVAILCVLFLLGYGIYTIASKIVIKSYSSGEVVLDNTPEGTPLPTDEGKVIGSTTDVEGEIIPEKIYEEEGIVFKSKQFLGSRYSEFEQLFKDIVAMGDEPFDSLDPENCVFTITEEDEANGIVVDQGIYNGFTVLDDYDIIDIGLYAGVDTQGAVAVYCYDGVRVVYWLDTEKPSFLVVDYSQNVFSENADFVEFGSIVGSNLWFVRDMCNKQVIDGYDVYFSYDIYVEKEWDNPEYYE